MASLEGEGACLGKFNEAPLDQFGEGSRGGVLGKPTFCGGIANGQGERAIVPAVVAKGEVDIERPRLCAEGTPGGGFQEVSRQHDERFGPAGPALVVVSWHGDGDRSRGGGVAQIGRTTAPPPQAAPPPFRLSEAASAPSRSSPGGSTSTGSASL